MKKFFAMAVFALSVFILQMPQAQADNEKYVGKYATGYDVYLLLNSYNFNSFANMDFTCKVKATNGRDVQYIGYHFWTENGSAYFKNSDGYGGRVTDDPNLKVEATIFKFTLVMANEYLKSRR